eukprot:750130-Hanusia_phi.AAC.6
MENFAMLKKLAKSISSEKAKEILGDELYSIMLRRDKWNNESVGLTKEQVKLVSEEYGNREEEESLRQERKSRRGQGRKWTCNRNAGERRNDAKKGVCRKLKIFDLFNQLKARKFLEDPLALSAHSESLMEQLDQDDQPRNIWTDAKEAVNVDAPNHHCFAAVISPSVNSPPD